MYTAVILFNACYYMWNILLWTGRTNKTRDKPFFGHELQLLIFIERVQCYLWNKKTICTEPISEYTSCRAHKMPDTCLHSEGNIHKDAPQHVKLHPTTTTTEIQFCAMMPHLGETSPYCLYDKHLCNVKLLGAKE